MEENNNMQIEKNKFEFFKKVKNSITQFDKYYEMASEGIGKAIIYLVKVMIIFSIILCLGFVYTSYISVNKIADYIQNELPDLSYQDGILNVNSEEAIVIQPDASSMINKIIINTKVEDENIINEYINSDASDEIKSIAISAKSQI